MKIACLVWDGEPIVLALEREWRKLGADILHIDVKEQSARRGIMDSIKSFGAELIFTHNSYAFDIRVAEGAGLESDIKKSGIPLVTWYWDSPWASGSYSMVKRFCEGDFPAVQLAVCVDEENARQLTKGGIQSVILPIGVDLERFKRNEQPLPEAMSVPSISFVGKPNIQIPERLLTRERVLFHHCKTSFDDFCALVSQTRMKEALSPELFRKDILRVRDLLIEFFHVFCWNRNEFEMHRHRLLSDAENDLSPEGLRELIIYVGRLEFLYSWWMLNDLLYVLKDREIRVFGGDEWGEKYLGDYAYKTPRLSEEQLCQVFSQSPINLCHTKWQFRTAAHERPFLIAACRGFSLTDMRSGLRDCFTEDEVPVYENRDDLFEKIDFFSKNSEARDQCAARAYQRAVRDHGYDTRARQLMRCFEMVMAGKAVSLA